MKQNRFTYILLMLIFAGMHSFAQKGASVKDSLINVLKADMHDTSRAGILSELAYEYIGEDREVAMKYAQEVLDLSRKNNFIKGEAQAHNLIGLALYNSNKYDEAVQHFQSAYELSKKMNDTLKMAVALNNTGLVYDDKAEYKKALEYYLQSLRLAESTGNLKQTAGTLNNLALIYQNLKNYDEALKFHYKALRYKQELGYKKGIASSLHNLGMVYKLKGEYEKSLQFYEKAMEVRRESKDESGMALTLNNIGSVYESMKEYEKALTYFEESLRLRQNLKDDYNLAITLFSLGSNYCNRGKFEQGYKYLGQAMEIAERIKARELIRYGYETLAGFAAQQKNFEKAYAYQQKLIEVKDSILNSETARQITELQTKYESDKKEREIQLLTKDSEIQALQLNRNKLWMIVLLVLVLLIVSLTALLYTRYKSKQRANDLLEHRNIEITQQKKEITDSINYAKRIQESILPPTEHWKSILPDSFIFYRPKDIVSGDFYWIEQRNGMVCFAAVDCTGHGVPGALMSVVGFNLLTQAVNEVGLTRPSDILKHLDAGVTKTLRQSETGKGVKDGMDLSLCCLNMNTGELQYAGAFNSLYYFSNGALQEIKADKFPIGVNLDGIVDEYRNHSLQLKKGDAVYLFSDGYADQFGGPRGKKFKYNQLKQLFSEHAQKPMDEQRRMVEQTFDSWKGGLEQVDDVVIIGVRI